MAKRGANDTEKGRADGRKSFLTYLPKDLIRRLKTAAVNEERHAYEIMEEALRTYFAERHRFLRKTGSA